jgi:hypothetical protein
MQKTMKAGLWLATAACAIGAATWMQRAGDAGEATHATQMQGNATPAIALPADATRASPQPFRIDATVARAAVRDGTLHLRLPDGRDHAIAIERQFTDETGHWNIVGRAPTRLGTQAMVLTFGGDAVFGRIPMPDGSAMHVFTAPQGRVVVAPDGGIVPEGAPQIAGKTDVVVPEREHLPQAVRDTLSTPRAAASAASRFASKTGSKTVSTAAASRPLRIEGSTSPATSQVATPNAYAAAVDTTPVTIDVITVYSPEQVALRGSAAAVQTEIANLFAISNQAHIDSGSRVRLRSVHTRQVVDVPATMPNTSMLPNIANNYIDGVSLEDLRDAYGGDLVTMLRPHNESDWTCGVAYLPGLPYWRTQTISQFGYGVISVDGPCGTLVHAHEIGHNLGSMHDRPTDTNASGVTSHGAYVFSSGYSTKAFATVMAYRDGSLEQQWIGRFSNPAKTDCVGAPCGIAGYSDNVRSLNLMAPAIAVVRGPGGQLSIPDVEAIEPEYDTRYVAVPIRLSGVAPVDGIAVQVQVVGGTATVGEDYEPIESVAFVGGNQREGLITIALKPDTIAEGDETIQLHIVAPEGTLASDPDATFTISESDTRIAKTGHVWFPPGQAPTEPVYVQVEGIDGHGTFGGVDAFPPDFDFTVRVPWGMQVRSYLDLGAPLVHPRDTINEVRDDREWQLFVQKGVHVSGQLKVAEGMTMPTDVVQVSFEPFHQSEVTYYTLDLTPPDYAYSMYVPATSNVRFRVPTLPLQPGAVQFAAYDALLNDLRSDVTFDVVLSNLPTARACCDWQYPEPIEGTQGTYIAVNLSAPAPPGGARMRWYTIDGTAKSGFDYVGQSGTLFIPEGEQQIYGPTMSILSDKLAEGPEYFDIMIDAPVGVQIAQPRARMWILSNGLATGGPQPALR